MSFAIATAPEVECIVVCLQVQKKMVRNFSQYSSFKKKLIDKLSDWLIDSNNGKSIRVLSHMNTNVNVAACLLL